MRKIDGDKIVELLDVGIDNMKNSTADESINILVKNMFVGFKEMVKGLPTIDEDEERTFTRDEVQRCINGAINDAINGYTDLIPEDYV